LTAARTMAEWVKAIHILAVISWMAGLFYLPRLMVYHCGARPGSETSEVFKVMERRLLSAIMRPAASVTLLSGGFLLSLSGFELFSIWLVGKLSAVFLLFLFHGFLEKWVREFSADARRHDGRFFRVVNEVPTVLLVAIVIFVVVKPFQ
jgi:protoporphyrinogen IX oxidase